MRGLLLALFLAGSPAVAGDWGPWGNQWPPVGATEATRSPAPSPSGPFERLYRQYRDLSKRDGPRCPFYPTCSAYFILSVRAHGPVVASLLLIDRLSREHPRLRETDHYPIVTPHETPRLHDPVPLPRHRGHRRGQ